MDLDDIWRKLKKNIFTVKLTIRYIGLKILYFKLRVSLDGSSLRFSDPDPKNTGYPKISVRI